MRPAWIAAATLAGLLSQFVDVRAQQERPLAPRVHEPKRPAFSRASPADAAGAQSTAAHGVPSPRQVELRTLVLQDCGSCHGMRLTGGLGPALTAAALRDRPVDSLVATIVHGRPGTAMPPWDGLLTQVEAAWIVERLIEGDFTDGR